MIFEPIDTPLLRLRHFAIDEAEQVMKLNGEPTTRRWLPSHVYADMTEAEATLRYLINCYSSPGDPRQGPYVLAVEHLVSGNLLGHVGFSPLDDEVEVSYAIAEDARGCGYGTDALFRACQWAVTTFDLPGVLAITESENTPSRRTLERAGFGHAGDLVMRFQGSKKLISRYLWQSAPTTRKPKVSGSNQCQ